ncbi:MAG TPA: hypothetical protein VN963_09315 [bacterium]|nr:hypothetical protein [bacterium]
MNRNKIALIVLLYSIVILIGRVRPYLDQISSASWAKALAAHLQEPLRPTERG